MAVDAGAVQSELFGRLSLELSSQYSLTLRRFFSAKITKRELDSSVASTIGVQNLWLHNKLLRAILATAEIHAAQVADARRIANGGNPATFHQQPPAALTSSHRHKRAQPDSPGGAGHSSRKAARRSAAASASAAHSRHRRGNGGSPETVAPPPPAAADSQQRAASASEAAALAAAMSAAQAADAQSQSQSPKKQQTRGSRHRQGRPTAKAAKAAAAAAASAAAQASARQLTEAEVPLFRRVSRIALEEGVQSVSVAFVPVLMHVLERQMRTILSDIEPTPRLFSVRRPRPAVAAAPLPSQQHQQQQQQQQPSNMRSLLGPPCWPPMPAMVEPQPSQQQQQQQQSTISTFNAITARDVVTLFELCPHLAPAQSFFYSPNFAM